MNLLLVTSPHLDHTAFHRAGYRGESAAGGGLAQRFVPMGLLSLAGAVDSDVRVSIADINKAIGSGELPMTEEFYVTAARWLLGTEPDLIGFMTEADSYHHLLRIISAIKAERSSAYTLLGGPHASAVHRDTVLKFPEVDFVVRGEGEIALGSLVEVLANGGSLRDVGNLTFRERGEVVTNPEFPLIESLDSLPFPDLSRIDYEADDQIFLEIGRGCPFRCNFCFTAPYWKRRHRIKSAERIIEELIYLKRDYIIDDLNFTHDLFTTDRRWVIDFCRKLEARSLGVTWTCSSRTDTLDEEQIDWLRRAGCRNIYFGVEAGTPEMQARIRKDLDLEQARRIIEETVRAGIGVTVGFIAGLPGESNRSLDGTLREAFHYLRLDRSTVYMFGFSPYRESPHFDQIAPDLVPDTYFVDFPLPERTFIENVEMMASSRGVFSRYSWMSTNEGIDSGILSAAEEYFPMVNALKNFMLVLYDSGIDQFDLLQNWARWVSDDNRSRGSGPRGLYQGSIAQYLVFVESYLRRIRWEDELIFELLRWETLKNALRSRSGDLPIPAMFRTLGHPDGGPSSEWPGDTHHTGAGASQADTILILNHSAILDRFTFAKLNYATNQTSNGFFAFYLRGGTPTIVRLSTLSGIALELAREGVSYGELLDTLCSGAGSGSRERAAEVIEELVHEDLLILSHLPPHHLVSYSSGSTAVS
jgi:radical SAM superfamily enzyme YgiQ (UPF0313 family)